MGDEVSENLTWLD